MCAQCHTKRYAASWLKTYDWMIILVDYMRDKYVLDIVTKLQEKGLFTPMDKWIVRNLGAMANRPTKMSAAHFGPDFVWWEGIMHFAEKIEEWLIDLYERPAIRKKAPEIIEEIEHILPWLKEQFEGETGATGATATMSKVEKELVVSEIEKTVNTLITQLPEVKEYVKKIEGSEAKEAIVKPLVTDVPVKTDGAVKVLKVDVGEEGGSTNALASLLALAFGMVAFAVRRVA